VAPEAYRVLGAAPATPSSPPLPFPAGALLTPTLADADADADGRVVELTVVGAAGAAASLVAPAAVAKALLAPAAAPTLALRVAPGGGCAVEVVLTAAGFAAAATADPECVREPAAAKAVSAALAWLFPHSAPETPRLDASALYREVAPPPDAPGLPSPPDGLAPSLHPYQARAVAWMLAREAGGMSGGGGHPLMRAVPGAGLFVSPTGRVSAAPFPAPPPVRGGILADEMGLGKTVELLALVLARRAQRAGPPAPFAPPATARGCACGQATPPDVAPRVKVTCACCGSQSHGACAGLSRAPAAGAWWCGACRAARSASPDARPPAATLIVCPAHLLAQWAAELARHVAPGALTVATYLGQGRSGGGAVGDAGARAHGVAALGGPTGCVSASDLASFDIVLTSYDVLAKDVHRVGRGDEEGGAAAAASGRRGGRRPANARYPPLMSPLTRTTWWRLVLDEAQEVEGAASGAARLAACLRGVHKWAVTGTPVSAGGVADLGGLLSFLGAAPFDTPFWWRRVTRAADAGDPTPRWGGGATARASILTTLDPARGGLLWRSSKAAVAAESGIPPQGETETRLALAPVEAIFYAQTHAATASLARGVLPRELLAAAAAGGDRPLTRDEEKRVVAPLLALRQAACHPGVGAHGLRAPAALGGRERGGSAEPVAGGGRTTGPLTMAAVLATLTSRAVTDAEEAQRVLIAALNGLAGAKALAGDAAGAADAYRRALAVADANEAQGVRADNTLMLHATANLAALVDVGAVPAEAGDDRLAARAADIRDSYMAAHMARLADAEGELDAAITAAADAGADDAPPAPRARGRAPSRQPSSSPSLTLDPDFEHGGGWYLAAIDALASASSDRGASLADRVRDALDAAHAGSRAVNATSLARQMAPGAALLALKPVLAGALDRLAAARGAALAALATLRARVAALDPALVAAAGACGRCRGGDLGAAGAVCPHCELDRTLLALEASLFALTTRAMAGGGGRAGVAVSPEVALAAAHAAAVRRVGRGGLGEAGGGEAASGRRADGVASVEILHHPSEVERVLLLLKDAVDKKGKGRSAGADLAAAAKAGAARLASLRSAFFKVTAATLAQRAALYAADELSMATSTLVMDDGGGGVDRGSARAATGVARAELPARARALEAEAAAAHHDLGVAIGQLRYLSSLAGGGDAGGNNNPRLAAPNNPSAPPDPGACPVCHDDIEGKLSMLPCGHVLCHACAKALAKRARARAGGTWGGGRAHINCPTCRRECSVADALRVVMRGEGEEEDKEEAAPSPPSPQRPPSPPPAPAALPPSYVHPGEADLDFVDDSFGTKATAVARRVKAILAASPDERVLVFSSWAEVLDVVAASLAASGVRALRPKGGKSVGAAATKFCACAPGTPRVILLLVRQGAAGLTLTSAQHVVLVEPLLDPGAELQALGRVQRVGQTQVTTVHRFVVEHTVEGSVAALASARRERAGGTVAAGRRGKASPLSVADVAVMLGL